MLLKFTKMQGLGKDFMVVDAITQKIFFSKELIKKLSDRHFGIGFDELVLIEPPFDPDVDFHFSIFSADGTEIDVSGNGARCVMQFVIDHKLAARKNIRLSSSAGLLQLSMNPDNTVNVNFGAPVFAPEKIPFVSRTTELSYRLNLSDGTSIEHGAVSVGTPHAVIFCEDLKSYPVEKYGPMIESHENFPERVNVGFAQVVSKNFIKLRVYERGLGETLCCATGACAAAVVAIAQGRALSPVTVGFKGGNLKVSWDGGRSPVILCGPVQSVYEGSVTI